MKPGLKLSCLSPPGTSLTCMVLLVCILCASCKQDVASGSGQHDTPKSEVLIKKRKDGTISSINQIDENGIVHGSRVTFYADGKTVYYRLTVNHGIKNGPFIRYFKNGQIYLFVRYRNGEKHGQARKYYKDGSLMAEYAYDHGIRLQDLKEYNRDGTLVTDYPEIHFREEDHLASRNRLDLHIYSTPVNAGIKYYIVQRQQEEESRVHLISEQGTARRHYYIQPGDTLNKKKEIIAEIPTKLGNVMVKRVSHEINVTNSKQEDNQTMIVN
jgi:hypothetical protein